MKISGRGTAKTPGSGSVSHPCGSPAGISPVLKMLLVVSHFLFYYLFWNEAAWMDTFLCDLGGEERVAGEVHTFFQDQISIQQGLKAGTRHQFQGLPDRKRR